LFNWNIPFHGAEIFFMPWFILFVQIINNDFTNRAYKIKIDVKNEIITINYFSFFNRQYISSFKKTEVKIESTRDNMVEKIEFLNRKSFFYDTICIIKLEDNIYSKETFTKLCEKLGELTFYKK
jgi:hypothetical protein